MDNIIISHIHSGRFGNKILHYHNAYQLSKYYNCSLYLKDTYFSQYFDIDILEPTNIGGISDKYNFYKLKSEGYDSIFVKNIILEPCLGEMFFEFDYDSKNMLKFKKEFNYINNDNVNIQIGVHFRGTDFHQWNPMAVLDDEYYINSIEYCIDNYKQCKFNLFTDDETLVSYNKVINYIESNNLLYTLGNNNKHFIHDFSKLSNSDVIISTPSTFSICAGFLKKEKDIIHSKKWVKSRIERDDKFWIDLYNGGNKNYKLKKLI